MADRRHEIHVSELEVMKMGSIPSVLCYIHVDP